jgi:hypothetical protein
MAQSQDYVNIGNTSLVSVSTANSYPRWPYEGDPGKASIQTVPFLARGAVQYTAINLANNNLTHACDITLTLPNISLAIASLTEPLSVLTGAIQTGKNRAAAIIRSAMTLLVNQFRDALDAIIIAIGIDPTGLSNISITLGKDLVRQLTKKLKDIEQYIADAAMYYYLIRDIQQIIAWVQTLPDKIKAIIQQCLTNLQNSVNQVTSQITNITTNLQTQVTAATTTLATNLQNSATTLQNSVNAQNGNLDPALIPIVGGSTSNSDLANLASYIANSYPSTASVIANNFSTQASTATPP